MLIPKILGIGNKDFGLSAVGGKLLRVDLKAVGARIADARERRGLKQVRLAELAGFSDGTLQNYEAGRIPDGVAKLASVARALGVTLDWLVFGGGSQAAVDAVLLATVLAAIERGEMDGLVVRSIEHRAKLIAHVYNKVSADPARMTDDLVADAIAVNP